MSEDIAEIRAHLTNLEERLSSYHSAQIEASRLRHAYLFNNAFGMARLVMLIFGFLSSAALGGLAHHAANPFVRPPFAALLGVTAFFLLFWLTQRGTKRMLDKQQSRDSEALPVFPEWQGKSDG